MDYPTYAINDIGVGRRPSFKGKYPQQTIDMIINSSLKHGVDPTLGLAVGLQESNLGKYKPVSDLAPQIKMLSTTRSPNLNPMNYDYTYLKDLEDVSREEFLNMSEEERTKRVQRGAINAAINHLKMKMENSPIKNTLAHRIQAYNGLGKLAGGVGYPEFQNQGRVIDTKINPVFGQRVLDLRDKAIMQSPEIMKRINELKLPYQGVDVLNQRWFGVGNNYQPTQAITVNPLDRFENVFKREAK